MLKPIRIIFLLSLMAVCSATTVFAQKQKIDWLSPDQLHEKYQQTPKPILVDVYTNWCHYCKVMDKTTWANDSVVAYVNENFYPVKMDAEFKQPYQWMGKKYEYNKQYKVNMLAAELLGGRMSYPSTLFLPVKGNPEVIQGAFSAKELETIIKYYGSESNEKMKPEAFLKIFKGNWK